MTHPENGHYSMKSKRDEQDEHVEMAVKRFSQRKKT